MSMQFMFDIRSWVFGFVFSRYKLLISIGPLSIWFTNEKRYYRDMEKAYAQQYPDQQGGNANEEGANKPNHA